MFLLTSEDVIRITINGRKYCIVYLYIEVFHSFEIRKIHNLLHIISLYRSVIIFQMCTQIKICRIQF